MKEYIDELLEQIRDELRDGRIEHRTRAINKIIKSFPVTDVEEVVRCKDCVHYNLKTVDGGRYCEILRHESPTETDYCCYGCRRSERDMTEKQKLDQLIVDYYLDTSGLSLSEYLVKHNVIVFPFEVLPCDVGAMVYEIIYTDGCGTFIKPVIKQKTMYSLNDIFHSWSCFGKTIFLTREEAEKKLKAEQRDA